tara:strand:+ start:1236 stop:2336 length:1101 start_codon:yes stop_codon:yes gene_type:complete
LSIKVCHISSAHPPFDVRIFHKECVSLAKAGFEVSLVVTHDKAETVNGVNIVPLPESKGRLHRMFIKTHFAFYRSLKTKSKIYHFHDPELMGVGILLKILGKKVIFDSHENVSSQIEEKQWLGNKFTRTIIKSFYRLLERFAILFFDSVISVTPEIVEFLSPKKGVLVRNYPILSLIENSKTQEVKNNLPKVIYVGGLSRIRGIKEICEAVEMVGEEMELILVGLWESESFKEECLSNKSKINYLGKVPLEQVYPIMKTATIGMSTLYPVHNYLNSLPIKAFEYMACKKPIIMSNIPYWEKEFDGSAIFVNPKSAKDIAEKITWMLQNPEEAKKIGEFGYKTVNEKYSWDKEAETLLELYQKLASN